VAAGTGLVDWACSRGAGGRRAPARGDRPGKKALSPEEEAERRKLIKLKKDERSGTFIVTGFSPR